MKEKLSIVWSEWKSMSLDAKLVLISFTVGFIVGGLLFLFKI